ncbi:MAG TPA: glycolate oxidase subunit GlcF [Burkholderiales bacterium]|nr:glycolate oxidase subunit GlcF [Burkholderiales bacterium]
METHLADWIRGTAQGDEAEAILRKCVHCGFCTATCPTYQLLGDELDGPRGRIYLMKQMLEGEPVTRSTQLHLDRCLTCRACETTCPSGVEYGRLADVGRAVAEQRVPRPLGQRALRALIARVFPRRGLFAFAVALGRMAKRVAGPLLPRALADKIPGAAPAAGAWPPARHPRRMLALRGCVQPALAPETNAAAARVLDRLGISLLEVPAAGCCGALRYHLNFQADGLDDARRLIDAWWPMVEGEGIEALVMTASGCGAMVKEYGHLLRHDAAYADKAARISAMTRDIAEVLAAEPARLEPAARGRRIAFQSPCTLQHGQQLPGVTEGVLRAAGFELCAVQDAHLCCGSAGTYSILQPELSQRLRDNKLRALQAAGPDSILTANIGCQSHLAGGAAKPVKHWIVALDEMQTVA